MPIKLGELLLKENMVTPQQLQEALDHQKANGGPLDKAFVSLGFVTDEEIMSFLSRQYGVVSINLDHFEADPTIIKIIPAETARKYQVLPLSRSGAVLTIAMADPTNVFAMDDIKFMTGFKVEPVVVPEHALEEAINRHYDPSRAPKTGMEATVGSPLRMVRRAFAAFADYRLAKLGRREVRERKRLARALAASGLSPDDTEFVLEHLLVGRVFRKYGLNDKARDQFQAVLERFPYNVEALLELADTLKAIAKVQLRGWAVRHPHS